MGKVYDTKIDDGIATFTFTNNSGEVFSEFKVNPADVGIAARVEETMEFWDALEDKFNASNSPSDIKKLNDQIEDKFRYILGEKACESLFSGLITATTILPSGEIFAFIVLDKLISFITPELERRNAKTQKAVEKYTAKYKK